MEVDGVMEWGVEGAEGKERGESREISRDRSRLGLCIASVMVFIR